MRIALTGAHGFIGKWLWEALEANGHQIHPSPFPGYYGWDFTDDMNVTRWLLEEDDPPDVLIHAAAVVGRVPGELFLQRTAAVNAGMTAKLADISNKIGSGFVYISSSEANHPLNMYGLSKRWGEQAATMYHESPLILRLSMPFGPGYKPGAGRGAITNFLWNALHNEPITVHQGSTRSYCWVGDTVAAIRMLTEQRQTGFFHVGRADQETTMMDVARMAIGLTESRSMIVEVPCPENFRLCKPTAFHRLYEAGWEPTVGLEAGMIFTLDWLRNLC